MNPTYQTSSTPLFRTFFDKAPRREEGPSLLQDVPMEILTPLSSALQAKDPCTLLSEEIAYGNYQRAVLMIEQDKRPPWQLKQTGGTPLHMLAISPFTPEEIHTLNDLLLQRGYNPLLTDGYGQNYLFRLIERQDIPASRLYLIILAAWRVNPDILHPDIFTQIFQRITESSAYSYAEKRGLIMSISGHLSEQEGCRCLNDCIMKIVNSHPPYAAIKLSIILNLLEERSSLHHFRMNWYQDIAGRNLIHIVLQDNYASVEDLYLAVKALVAAGCNINHLSHSRNYPLLSVLQSAMPFDRKKMVAERLIDLKAERYILIPGTTRPAFRALLENNIEYKSNEELAELTKLLTGRSYYQEYFYLTLLSNLFSIDFEWKQDGFTLDTSGLAKNETQIASWLEWEAWDFYASLVNPNHPRYSINWKEIMDTLSPEAAKTLSETDWKKLHPALLNVQSALSRAFLTGKDQSNGLYFASEESLVAFVATLASTQDNFHDIGIAFKKNVAYLCNKGFGTPDSGVSAHPLSHRKIQKMKSDIDRGMSVRELIDNYFPSRAYSPRQKARLVFAQKKQIANNCPIASYTSLEMATLHAAIKGLFRQKRDVAAELARVIKDLHRLRRREIALANYLHYHTVQRDIAINSHILMAIGRETAKVPSRWLIADLIIDKTKNTFPALSAFIASLKKTTPGAS